MIRRLALLALVPLLTLGACAPKSRLKVGKVVDGEVVEADGYAPYDANDLVKTKRASLADAQRNAVEKAVGVFVSGRTLVDKAVAIENTILAKTEGYIQKYDILSEGVEGSMYKTRIRALVSVKDLERDLRDMALLHQPELQRPRVTVALTENVDKALVDDNVAGTALEHALQNQGFVVLSNERAKEADLTITGNASAFPFQSTNLGGFVSFRSRLSLQVLRTGTKQVVSSLTKEASGLGGNADLAAMKSLESVGDLVGGELGTQLADSWSAGKSILVYVEGAQSVNELEDVRKALSGQPGVGDLMLRNFEEHTAQFELQMSKAGSATDIAKGLESAKLHVLEASGQTIRLKIGQ